MFKGNPSVKDSVESLGVPHTEIDLILVNGQSVDFNRQLRDGDQVSVYPVFESLDISPLIRLRAKPLRNPRFILDVHLGRLAKKLRMLGFDSLYQNDYTDPVIIDLSLKEKRIILTCDRGILKNKSVTHGYWIRSRQVDEQLREVIHHFDLSSRIDAFWRCMVCNGTVKKVHQKMIEDRLLPRTAQYFNEFYICEGCHRIYWKGSHYQKMEAYIQKLVKDDKLNEMSKD